MLLSLWSQFRGPDHHFSSYLVHIQGILDSKSVEVNELTSSVYLSLQDGLALSYHGGGKSHGTILSGQKVSQSQENGSSMVYKEIRVLLSQTPSPLRVSWGGRGNLGNPSPKGKVPPSPQRKKLRHTKKPQKTASYCPRAGYIFLAPW